MEGINNAYTITGLIVSSPNSLAETFSERSSFMGWIDNANTIASLILAFIGIGGYCYGAVTYLRKKAAPTQQPTDTTSQTAGFTAQKSSVYYRAFTFLEWMEFFGQGLVDTADFILRLCFQKADVDIDDWSILGRLAACFTICLFGGLLGVLILGAIINGIFAGLGMQNASGAAGVIGFILYMLPLSLMYIYHVGLQIEEERYKQYVQAMGKQQQTQQSKSW